MTDAYCLSNFIDFSQHLSQPLRHSNRIKYTCFDISDNYIIFGATSGSLYFFNRGGKFMHLIPNKHGPVTHLSISANNKYVAFATQRSLICVYAVNLSAQAAPQVIVTHLSTDQSVQVSCIHWTPDEKQFYYGDTRGQVNLVIISTFIGHSLLFNMSVHPLLYLDAPIVQIDDFESLLLVSNNTKCILCNTEYEEYKQIGNRPRDGAFGACFFISPHESLQPSRIYCARPGTRIWEVDFEGEVVQTHQFKAALATAPVKILKASDHDELNNANNADGDDALESNDELLDHQPQQLQFAKLQRLGTDFMLAYTELGLYIFDVRLSTVVLWCNQFERIVDCRVAGNEIFVFTQTGSLYGVQLQTLQSHAISLIEQSKLTQCARLLRQHVKYFADKARENYELKQLNLLKQWLIERQQYELLNDISVIFDAIAQCTGSALDTHSSGGSSATTERSVTTTATPPPPPPPPPSNQADNPPRGVYVLENAFCDNLLKQAPKTSGHFKDALLTVTGKFGKNIIKYKFNIFAEEQQQQLVRELIPPSERSLPFKDIKARYESQDDDDDDAIVCRSSRSLAAAAAGGKRATSTPSCIVISPEEKTIYNLYLIHKSAKFSRTHCVERYRGVFDEYAASELIQLLEKLAGIMIEHGDSAEQAQRNCYEMYFNYLNPELIWEMDDATRDYIASGFARLNAGVEITRCTHCSFPLRFDNACAYHGLGAVLLRYYWSRGEQLKCFDVLQAVPALLDILAKFYLAEHNLAKVLPIVLNYGAVELFQDVGRQLNGAAWARCFEQFVDVQRGRLICVNCERVTSVEREQLSRHFFYTWNCFLNIALDHLSATETLALIFKWSSYIPSDAIDREFYTRCLLKG
ncbi:Hermansky-Pudlak syndrome 5 protein homolog [Drosophila grimshawi]|uniref:Hermansky-Pudlak syndrome 5 protein homolog n=2 Tax=picture wing clade TaxID=48384 RepID=B4JSS0_DROGR|nr:Hermansky-Pudlak syndrome 5 protein homolog [Drosophila grimshawi]EDV94810.1 GH22864 [Drosophila grimshawi]